jgi:hypothetical protein
MGKGNDMNIRLVHGLERLRSGLAGFLLSTLLLMTVAACTAKDKVLVITPEEFDAVTAAGEEEEPPLRGRVERGAPVITVETPDPDSAVRPPFPVRINFEPQDDASIAMDTLTVKYGFFNVTDKVLEFMTVSPTGIVGHIDAVRPGNYKLKLSVSDDRQRTGRTTLSFHIIE